MSPAEAVAVLLKDAEDGLIVEARVRDGETRGDVMARMSRAASALGLEATDRGPCAVYADRVGGGIGIAVHLRLTIRP